MGKTEEKQFVRVEIIILHFCGGITIYVYAAILFGFTIKYE